MTRASRSSVALLLAALLVAPAGPATAHDQLIGSDPEDGSTVEAPDEIELTFSGAIGDLGAQVAVTDGSGRSVVDGEPDVDGTVVEQDLLDDLADGDYAVTWRVTSEDGHPISGEFTFTVEGEDDSDDSPSAGTADGTASADSTGTADDTETAEATATTEDTVAEATAGTEEAAGTEETAGTDDADVTAEPAESQGMGGLPVWAWLVLALAGAGVAGLLARTWSRGRE